MKDDGSALPFLHVHRARAQSIVVYHTFGVEVSVGRPFLHICQHGQVTNPEPAVLSTSAPTVGEHVQELVLIDVVVTFAQSSGAVLVGRSKIIVRLAAQPHETVTGPLHLEQIRCPLVRFASSPVYGRPRVDSARIRSDVRRNFRTGVIRSGVGSGILVVPGS